MLGGDDVGDGQGLLGRRRPGRRSRRRRSVASRSASPGRGGHDPVDLAGHLLDHLGRPGHQPGQPVGPVLGLHDQVHGGEAGRGVGTGHHHHFGRTGEGGRHAHRPGHLALGLGHEPVARPGHHVHRAAPTRSHTPWPRSPGRRRSGRPRRPRRWRRRPAWRHPPCRRGPAARTAPPRPPRPPGPALRTSAPSTGNAPGRQGRSNPPPPPAGAGGGRTTPWATKSGSGRRLRGRGRRRCSPVRHLECPAAALRAPGRARPGNLGIGDGAKATTTPVQLFGQPAAAPRHPLGAPAPRWRPPPRARRTRDRPGRGRTSASGRCGLVRSRQHRHPR